MAIIYKKYSIKTLPLYYYDDIRKKLNDQGSYLEMYLELCSNACHKYNKRDFICDIYLAFEDLSPFPIGVAITQDLLYRQPESLELSIFVAKPWRGFGVSDKLIKNILKNKIKNKTVTFWGGDNLINFYKRTMEKESYFRFIDMDIYAKTGKVLDKKLK